MIYYTYIYMEERKRQILNTILEEHIETGLPVGSSLLVEKYKLGVSPATVRNIMADLEEKGYIAQPHTSAGRVPTEKAYKLLLEDLGEGKLKEKEVEAINEVFSKDADFRKVAKALAETAQTAVFWARDENDLYYTGMSNLFHQPEFSRAENIYDMGEVIDRMDEIVEDIFSEVDFEPEILIGSDNPFGDSCSSIIVKYRDGEDVGIFGILAPMRMDYERSLAIIKYVLDKLK